MRILLGILLVSCFNLVPNPVYIRPPSDIQIDWLRMQSVVKEVYPRDVILDLSSCGINSIPLLFFIGLENIVALYLHHNNLQEVPSSIIDLQRLKVLDCSYNKILRLPNEISDLSDLEILNCSHNNIERLPQDFKFLKNVEIVGLAYNNISVFPSEVATLYKLCILSLEGNPLTSIISIAALTQLRFFSLAFTSIGEIPKEFLPPHIRFLCV
jgi:Leucine-rich repeat (LRR) protein